MRQPVSWTESERVQPYLLIEGECKMEGKNNSKEIEMIDKILEAVRIIESLAEVIGKCCETMTEYEMGRKLEVCLELISEKAEEIRRLLQNNRE